MEAPSEDPGRTPFAWRKLWPVAVLLAGLILFFSLGLQRYVTPSALAEYSAELKSLSQLWWSPLAFMVIYAVAVAFSLPGGAVMTIAGGYMFGQWLGTGCVVLAATAGATALFLIARSALGDVLRSRAGSAIARMEAGFREDAFSYLLVLRLVPLFPFWLVNLAPAFLGVPLRTYVLGTLIGIIPGTFVFATVGAGLESVLSQGGELTLGGILTPQVVTALLGLAVLALIPVVYKRIKARRQDP